MRSEREILDLIAHALRQKELHRQREAARLATETEQRRTFLQAARAVFTHVVTPEIERISGILQAARLRPTITDTGAYYLPGSADALLRTRFALPLLREQVELPLCVTFEAVFPVGIAVWFGESEAAEAAATGEVERVPLEEINRELVEDRLIRVLENYLQEL